MKSSKLKQSGLDVDALPPGLLLADGSLPPADAIPSIESALSDARNQLLQHSSGESWLFGERSLERRVKALEELLARVKRLADPEHQALLHRLKAEDATKRGVFAAIWVVCFLIALPFFVSGGLVGILLAAWFALIMPALVVTVLAYAAAHTIVTVSILAMPFRLLALLFRAIFRR